MFTSIDDAEVWNFIYGVNDSFTQTITNGGLASGCPERLLESNPNDIQNSHDMISTAQTGAVRCCNFDILYKAVCQRLRTTLVCCSESQKRHL